MSDNLKKILLFGGGAAILYYLLKPKTASTAASNTTALNNSNATGDSKDLSGTYVSPNGSIAIMTNSSFFGSFGNGISFSVFTYVLADGSLDLLYSDSVYVGDASYQVTKVDKSGLTNVIIVTNMPDKLTIAVTQNTNPVNIFQQSFDWSGNPVA